MDIIRRFRKQNQILAAEGLGLNAYWQRTSVASVMGLGHEAEMDRLPEYPYSTATQNPDTGSTFFVLGVSPLGGGFPLA